jgi:type I protein arginine methyltransferase
MEENFQLHDNAIEEKCR